MFNIAITITIKVTLNFIIPRFITLGNFANYEGKYSIVLTGRISFAVAVAVASAPVVVVDVSTWNAIVAVIAMVNPC